MYSVIFDHFTQFNPAQNWKTSGDIKKPLASRSLLNNPFPCLTVHLAKYNFVVHALIFQHFLCDSCLSLETIIKYRMHQTIRHTLEIKSRVLFLPQAETRQSKNIVDSETRLRLETRFKTKTKLQHYIEVFLWWAAKKTFQHFIWLFCMDIN